MNKWYTSTVRDHQVAERIKGSLAVYAEAGLDPQSGVFRGFKPGKHRCICPACRAHRLDKLTNRINKENGYA
jgi:hypothetical protein